MAMTIEDHMAAIEKLLAKPPKLPKNMGACADLAHALKTRRLRLDKIAEAAKSHETAALNYIIDNLPKGDTGAAGKFYRAQVKVEERPRVGDWDKFWPWVVKNNAFDCIQRRISDTAVADRLEACGKKGVPGVEKFNVVKVSLTKV